jgi:23S rRNA-/tRNA-specific pseudouridylate synthase
MIQTFIQHDDFTIVNKPAGLSCHNDVNSLIHQLGKGWHLVNRIDRETSGLVVVTQKSDLQNQIQFALTQGKKFYAAVLRGNMVQTSGIWHEWTYSISDQGEGRETPQGKLEDQKESKTLYTVVRSNPYFSAVHCQLITGRQHQIRKHSRLAGRPILGDPRYGNAKDNERISKLYDFHRMALHSWKLEFVWKDESIRCESPVPESFAQLFVPKSL